MGWSPKPRFYSIQQRQIVVFANDCIILVYVDDCLMFSSSSAIIDDVISQLGKTFILQDKGCVSALLGVQVSKDTAQKAIISTRAHQASHSRCWSGTIQHITTFQHIQYFMATRMVLPDSKRGTINASLASLITLSTTSIQT
jgi:hypothetical protein